MNQRLVRLSIIGFLATAALFRADFDATAGTGGARRLTAGVRRLFDRVALPVRSTTTKPPGCGDTLTLPLPRCTNIDERDVERAPIVAPQVIAPGVIRIALDASLVPAADAIVGAAVGDVRGSEYVFVDVTPQDDRIVHAGRCPSDGGYLAAFTLDASRQMHLLCLEYVPESKDRIQTSDPTFGGLGFHCRGPSAWHGTVTQRGVQWSAMTWLPDLCGGEIKQRLVLAIAREVPIVAYCVSVDWPSDGCVWRVKVLRKDFNSHWLGPGSTDERGSYSSAPHDFFVQADALWAIVSVPDPSRRYESTYWLVSLDWRGRMHYRALPAQNTVETSPDSFNRTGSTRSPAPMTSFSSEDSEHLRTLLPLLPFDNVPVAPSGTDSDPLAPTLAQPFSRPGAVPAAGWKALGHGLSILPHEDVETKRASIRFPDGIAVDLDGRTTHWIRATCSRGCVATFRYLRDERNDVEHYPASLFVLRTESSEPTPGIAPLSAGTVCKTVQTGDLSCEQKE